MHLGRCLTAPAEVSRGLAQVNVAALRAARWAYPLSPGPRLGRAQGPALLGRRVRPGVKLKSAEKDTVYDDTRAGLGGICVCRALED